MSFFRRGTHDVPQHAPSLGSSSSSGDAQSQSHGRSIGNPLLPPMPEDEPTASYGLLGVTASSPSRDRSSPRLLRQVSPDGSTATAGASTAGAASLGTSHERRKRHLPPPGDLLHARLPPSSAAFDLPDRPSRSTTTAAAEGSSVPLDRGESSNSTRRTRSPGSSPRSARSERLASPARSPRLAQGPGSPRLAQSPSSPEGRKRHSPRVRVGTSGARMEMHEEADKRRRTTSTPQADRSERKKASPLAKRLGEDPPFMLPHPSHADDTSQTYPGVVIGAYPSGQGASDMGFGEIGGGFDADMGDILDPAAARGNERAGSTSGQAGANIAPWLTEDAAPAMDRKSPTSMEDKPGKKTAQDARNDEYLRVQALAQAQGKKHSMQVLNHFSSVPSLPKIRRQGTVDPIMEIPSTTASSRSGSHPSIFPYPQQDPSATESASTSRDSVHTLSAFQKNRSSPTSEQPAIVPSQQRGSNASRLNRLGSTVSNVSGTGSVGSEKKRGFLGGFLKRKATGATLPGMDFNPDGSHRGSTSGSTGSRMSTSTSYGSLNAKGPPIPTDPFDRLAMNQQGFATDALISPLHEMGEPEFMLDMNLDDMEGIVDPTLANAPPTQPFRVPPPGSTGSGGSVSGQAEPNNSMLLQDALHHTGSQSGMSGSQGSSGSGSDPNQQTPGGRSVLSEADRGGMSPFGGKNPFQSSTTGSSNGSIDSKPRTPPSPYNLSPKHSLPASTQPRRPSQLRNVKMGSIDSDASYDSSSLQPLTPAWVTSTPANPTVFNDPFGSSANRPGTSGSVSTQLTGRSGSQTPYANRQDGSFSSEPGNTLGMSTGGLAPAPVVTGAAAWAAPESWGVEADEDPEDGEETTSSDDDEDWADDGDKISEVRENDSRLLSVDSGKTGAAPPFGYKSGTMNGKPTRGRPATKGSMGGRTRTSAGGRTSTGRPRSSGRPGTSGSAVLSAVPHKIRIYRADGSYNIMSFPLLTSTAELLNVLAANDAGPGKKVSTTMRLYLRERGQDRQLQPSEKPVAIQTRRLLQAGFTEAEHLEELGKTDLSILCRFIYQTPILPVMRPDEESLYDSFEMIDLSGRDLQTIPIFVHMHAHNIVILNVSRNPMSDLPLDFIQAATGLKELRMTNMALRRIPASLRASETLARLDVSCNRIADLESTPLHEIASLVAIKLQNNKLASIPSYFAQMQSLKYLNISNNKFESFPAVVCEMSNLVDLDISFNNIAELPSEMSNLKSLERLMVFGNDLASFPKSFSTLANLRILDVRRNKLTDLTSVYALPNLSELQADFNNLVTLDAQIGAKVRQFSVANNSITRFTLAALPNMAARSYALTHLNLSHGKISSLADDALTGLVNLVDLNLDFNQFTRLPSVENLVNLETFTCTDNLLNSLPSGWARLQKLHTINVHNNNLREISGEIWGCSSLRNSNYSSNLLESGPSPPSNLIELMGVEAAALCDANMAPFGGLNGITRPPGAYILERLYVADNQLSSEVMHLIAELSGLKVLNVSFNDIQEIPPGTVSKLTKLQELYLSGCKLTSLPSEDLEKLQNLQVLHLNGNKLQTLPSELGAIKSLRHLDVGSNVLKYNIANWPYDWNWNWNTSLRYLNLSGNKRLEIKPTSAQDMSHASSLRKELSDFTALTELRVLGLMDVTLRIPSLPDESDAKRVRTSFSDINNMAYGISDMLGKIEHLAMFDMVVPNFRGRETECLFGMFGRAAPINPSGTIPKYLQDSFAQRLNEQLEDLQQDESPATALRRTFLFTNRNAFDFVVAKSEARKESDASLASIDTTLAPWSDSGGSQFRTGSSGAVVYLVDRTLHVGNVGDTLVVLSRKGEAELLSKHHDPTDREETARIRRAEAWVSTKGYVNDDKEMDISRAWGYWSHFPAVNASPEIRTRQLQESDEFVIIGNHALWKYCSYQTAVDIARTERHDPMMAAQKLRDFAISYGADGSVMVMVVNISDLFFGRGGRSRGMGSGSLAPGVGPSGVDEYTSNVKRAIRRRYEEVGDRTLNRLQQEIEPPQGQVAIVFTDIVNSTHLWETNPGMPTAIKMHHNLMRRQLRLDGGYEVKTEGDSFMVSFQTITAAILWCFNCQIGLLQQEWPRELLECPDGGVEYDSEGILVQRGLRVRMGVHWGAPQCERDPITRRMDYYGPMVNRAARINASADGGQLMASQDVINEIEALSEYLHSLDEQALGDLPPEMKREVQELRRIGIEMRDMGERKLKGLEVPEKLHLLYAKGLAGRFEINGELRASVEVGDQRPAEELARQIDINEVRELSSLVLRLEAISGLGSAITMQPIIQGSPADPRGPGPASPRSPRPAVNGQVGANDPMSLSEPIGSAKESSSPQKKRHTPVQRMIMPLPPPHLGPQITEDMTDEELSMIIDSLTTRLENTLSTIYLKHLGNFSNVLAALEHATKIDPKLIIHAMALMNGSGL